MNACVERAAVSITAAALLAVGLMPVVSAQDAAAGGRKATACQACHGLDGIAKLPDAPHLAAQSAAYLERALRAYRSGARNHETMSVVAKTLSDDDIRDLAAYYSAIEIEVKSLPR